MATQQLPPDARFSTYSGAPSIQPSLAPTFSTATTASKRTSSNSARTSRSRYSSRSAYTMSAPASRHASQPSSTSTAYSSSNEKPAHSKVPYAYSGTTANESTSTLGASNDPKAQDIKTWHQGFERMQDERLDKQRYVMSGNKSEEVSKIALGAKVERALGRRMVGQDASFSTRKVAGSGSGEKAVEVEVK